MVKIKTGDNVFEYIITNLPGSFDISDIKDCYHWSWGIEIPFRYLKHAAGLLYFHSKKPAFLKQEIYASLVLYNFGVLLANEAAAESRRKKRRPGNKHQYHSNIWLNGIACFLEKSTLILPILSSLILFPILHQKTTPQSEFLFLFQS